jgi:hypothetical protein
MKIMTTVLSLLVVLTAVGWLGLQIKPRPFASYPTQIGALQTVPLPDDLPAPVARHYHQLYGEAVPVITSAVVSGRATIRPFGFDIPARFRFVYEAGQGYRHYIEGAWFSLPIMKVNEWYLDGHGRLELPILGVVEGPHTDQGANLGMWAESAFLPAILITDPRVRWEAIDEETALLIVPFGEAEQQFVVRFDPESGRQYLMEAMRYRDEESDKILWLAASVPGETITVAGAVLDAVGSATWLDQGTPWAIFTTEQIVYNVDVQKYIRVRGP